MADDGIAFEFEAQLTNTRQIASSQNDGRNLIHVPPQEVIGQQPGNYKKNFKKTVCTYWLRGMCMKGDQCGFLHQFDVDRMPVCRNLTKYGECKELDCPFKHNTDEIKECNMYKLGFCIYGPQCRYKHKPAPGPVPAIETIEACKPREMRDVNRWVNSVNPGVIEDREEEERRGGWVPRGGRGRGGYPYSGPGRSFPSHSDRDAAPAPSTYSSAASATGTQGGGGGDTRDRDQDGQAGRDLKRPRGSGWNEAEYGERPGQGQGQGQGHGAGYGAGQAGQGASRGMAAPRPPPGVPLTTPSQPVAMTRQHQHPFPATAFQPHAQAQAQATQQLQYQPQQWQQQQQQQQQHMHESGGAGDGNTGRLQQMPPVVSHPGQHSQLGRQAADMPGVAPGHGHGGMLHPDMVSQAMMSGMLNPAMLQAMMASMGGYRM